MKEKWNQPILTSNGTLGGNTFAVTAINTDSRTQPYYVFDSNKTDAYGAGWLSKATNNYLEWYNPKPLNISQLQIQYQTTSSAAVGYISSWEIKVSNDGVNYESIVVGTQGNYGITTIPISHNKCYRYWRFCVLAWPIEWYAIIDMQIKAKEFEDIYI